MMMLEAFLDSLSVVCYKYVMDVCGMNKQLHGLQDDG
jgi:hypothetical protein